MKIIETFRQQPVSIQITWILAAAFVLLLAIPTYMNSELASNDGKSSRKIETSDENTSKVIRRERKSRYGKRDDLDDENYNDSGDNAPLDDDGGDDGSREFDKDFDDSDGDDDTD